MPHAGELLRQALVAANVTVDDVAAYMMGGEVSRQEAASWLQIQSYDNALAARLTKALRRVGIDPTFIDRCAQPPKPPATRARPATRTTHTRPATHAPPAARTMSTPHTAPATRTMPTPHTAPSQVWAWCGDSRHHWPHNIRVNSGAFCRFPKSQWIMLNGRTLEEARIHFRKLKTYKPR